MSTIDYESTNVLTKREECCLAADILQVCATAALGGVGETTKINVAGKWHDGRLDLKDGETGIAVGQWHENHPVDATLIAKK